MTNKIEHDALPWHSDEFGVISTNDGFVQINDGYEISIKNAEFIVRACNAHYQLIAALKRLVDNGGIGPTAMFEQAEDALKKPGAL